MKWQNLTPHAIRVLNADGTLAAEIAPSGAVARVTVRNVLRDVIAGIPVYTQETGDVTGLPEADGETMYVVSLAVRAAVPARRDVFSPGELRRGPDGQPTGCVGLVGNGGAQ